MNKKLLSFLLLFCLIKVGYSQDTLAVGTGSYANAVDTIGPMTSVATGSSWNRHAYIYPKSVLGNLPTNAILTSLEFYRVQATATLGTLSLAGSVTLKIYLKNTTANTWGTANTTWTADTTGSTWVYTGTAAQIKQIIGNTTGYKNFPFVKNFTYTGGNIAVMVEYYQAQAATSDVTWLYDNSVSVPQYVMGQTNYITRGAGTPTSGPITLDSMTWRHPYLRFVFTPPGCSGTPAVAVLNETHRKLCSGKAYAVDATSYTIAGGIGYQWQQSATPNGPWSNAANLYNSDTTTVLYTPNIFTNNVYYRLVTTCKTSGLSSYSATDSVLVTPQPNKLPYTMGFNSTSPQKECLSPWLIHDTTVSGFANAAITLPPACLYGNYFGTNLNDTIYPYEGDGMMQFNDYSNYPGDMEALVFPKLTTKNISSVDLSLWYYQINGQYASNDSFMLIYSPDGGTSWYQDPNTNTGITNTSYDSTANGWQQIIQTLTPGVANLDSLTVALLCTSGFGYNILIDNVQFAESGKLPVELVNFSGNRLDKVNKLHWTTANEFANKGFEIQRSTDGIKFDKIGFVATKAIDGTSKTANTYDFIDAQSTAAKNYYRLRQVDNNGKSNLSEVVLIRANGVESLEVAAIYPNPVQSTLNVNINSPIALNANSVITDMSGKIITTKTLNVMEGNNSFSFDVNNLKVGTYAIRVITADGNTETRLFNKK